MIRTLSQPEQRQYYWRKRANLVVHSFQVSNSTWRIIFARHQEITETGSARVFAQNMPSKPKKLVKLEKKFDFIDRYNSIGYRKKKFFGKIKKVIIFLSGLILLLVGVISRNAKTALPHSFPTAYIRSIKITQKNRTTTQTNFLMMIINIIPECVSLWVVFMNPHLHVPSLQLICHMWYLY